MPATRANPRTGMTERFDYFGSFPSLKLGRLTLPTSERPGAVVIAGSIDADQSLMPAIRAVTELLGDIGHVVLRFDYRGQGQSMGRPEDLNLEVMAEDVNEAAAWLQATHPVETLAVLGVGLGVNAAARAETALDAPLAMWDPITDFEVFLRRLARVKMATSMGFEDYGGVYDGRSLAEVVADDLIEDEYERDGSFDARGFTVGRALRDSMARNPLLDLTTSSSRALFDAGEPGVATATARWLDDRLSE